MNVQALLGKTADADFLREMIGFAAQRLMDLEIGGLTGAAYGEKSADRLAQRNRYRERDWETRAGTVELRIPQTQEGQIEQVALSPGQGCAVRGTTQLLNFPGFLEPRRLAESEADRKTIRGIVFPPNADRRHPGGLHPGHLAPFGQ